MRKLLLTIPAIFLGATFMGGYAHAQAATSTSSKASAHHQGTVSDVSNKPGLKNRPSLSNQAWLTLHIREQHGQLLVNSQTGGKMTISLPVNTMLRLTVDNETSQSLQAVHFLPLHEQNKSVGMFSFQTEENPSFQTSTSIPADQSRIIRFRAQQMGKFTCFAHMPGQRKQPLFQVAITPVAASVKILST
ncbi:hypothetical protein [Alicyclobacillus fodiniaquatilis]|uniref:Uncharacterized protein n=1 Tax=Alicyclobacillus fodiniaquatilis TaxID=1661150 RepID=A0ABW4JBH4_9BACL